mgnify:CR=1 FL=1
MSYRIFISHKNDPESNDIGADLGEFLREQGHTVFFDKDYLKAGMTWQQEIIDELLTSDVVIVILNEGTAESHWVQREIDMARARSISILPLNLKEISIIQDALDRFDLNPTQFIKLEGIGRKVEATYKKIAEILGIVDRTVECHVSILRLRLNCKNKKALITKLEQLPLREVMSSV